MNTASTRLVRRVAATLSVGLLALGACSSDGDTSTDDGASNVSHVSNEAFCAQLGTLAASDGTNAVTDLQDLAASAPDDIADDMSAFADLFAEMTALSEDGSDAAEAELTDKMSEYEALTGRLDAWSNENCPDLPANVFTEN